MRTVIASATLTSMIAGAPLVAQQSPTGRLEGTIAPWTATRPVHAAQVLVVNLESDASTTIAATVDASGRYRLDSLAPGRYLIQVSHPTLDSLDVTLPPAEAVITAGKWTRADFSLPSGDELRDVVCPGVKLGPGKAVVVGRAVDADTRAPLAGAHVIAAWTELTADRKSKQIVSQGKQAVVTTGQVGEYRFCGIPAVKAIELQLQHAGRASVATQLSITPAEGAVVRDLSMSAASAPTIAALDSLDRSAAARPSASRGGDSARHELALRGNATLAGTVRTTSGQPMPGAEVRVRHAAGSTLTDGAGRFVLADLPSGTQLLLVRRLGYALAEVPVDLRPQQRLEMNVRMTRAVELDSMRVIASRSKLAEFEYNRKTNLQGHFLTLSDIQRTKAKKTSELIPLLGGYVMMGRDRRPQMRESPGFGPPGTRSCQAANVVIDGVDGQGVDDVLPVQIAGIELYKNAAAAPVEYAGRADCGLIVIWLRPGPRWQGWRAMFTPPAKPE
jgi:hypothetical protein